MVNVRLVPESEKKAGARSCCIPELVALLKGLNYQVVMMFLFRNGVTLLKTGFKYSYLGVKDANVV